jgi:segregation and condensation protein B
LYILEKLAQHIEALVFATDTPVNKSDILECLEQTFETPFSEEDVDAAIEQVRERYAQPDFAIELVQISGGLQFMTKGAYHAVIASWLKLTTNKRLSKAALETLSIIAYKQPVSKSECEAIRGVSCDYSLQKLLEKELVSIVGRSEGPGRPLLYGTSSKFMDYFGLKDMSDLPKPKDFKGPDSEVGEVPIDEVTDARPTASSPGRPQPAALGASIAEGISDAIQMAEVSITSFTSDEEE